MAERAYQRVLEKGWSFYAFSRLLNIYTKVNNIDASLDCIRTALDYLSRRKGVRVYKSLPG